MIIRKRTYKVLMKELHKQSDAIAVLAKEADSVYQELIITQEHEDKLAAALSEAEKKLALIEDRNRMLVKAFNGMKAMTEQAVNEAAELRGKNKELRRMLDLLSEEESAVVVSPAFRVVE